MYAGYMQFGDVLVIDNHRTERWAKQVGLTWLKGCVQCAGIEPRGYDHVTPLKDAVKPPWWVDGSKDALAFFGLYGLRIDGADNSTREVDTIEGIADGGYMGARRNRMRTLTVKGIAVAETDTALGFGIDWLRTLDTGPLCDFAVVGMYESCPCVCGPGCDDPACQQACITPYQRELRKCRITSGPTVLSRQTMPSGGAMAEVEFQIVAADPKWYRPSAPFTFYTGVDFPITDNLFPAPPPDSGNPWVTPVESPEPEGRTEWLRTRQEVPLPDGFASQRIAPDIVVGADHGSVNEVRVTVVVDGLPRTAFLIPRVPAGASVRVDLGAKRAYTEWGGVEQANLGVVSGPDGGPYFWPAPLPIGEYVVLVDRPPASPPVLVSVALNGASL